MAVDLKHQLDRVTAKADLIIQCCLSLTRERDEALGRIAELEATLAARDKELAQMRVENENLRVVSAVWPDRSEVEKARSLISELVRDIDRCILDLKE